MIAHSAEFYDTYRNRVIETESVSHPLPGATTLGPIAEWRAIIISDHHYDTERVTPCNGCFAVMTRGGYVATIGAVGLDGKPAILHKRPDGTRELAILKTNF